MGADELRKILEKLQVAVKKFEATKGYDGKKASKANDEIIRYAMQLKEKIRGMQYS